jgi:outer membrane protein TolC
VARAAFLPTITLSAGDAITSIASGGTTTVASLASGLAMPIFAGGRLEAEIERTRSRFAELAAGYRQAVLGALKEAQDALVAMDAAGQRTTSLGIAAERAAEASRIANEQYAIGTGDFMAVLDSQRSLLSARDNYVQAQSSRYISALDLYKALGGGWSMTGAETTAAPR